MTTPPPIAPLAPVDVPTNHLLHFLMGLMTCGGWWLVWPFIHIGNTRANAARRRAYQHAVARYQRALWERENMPGQPARPTWTPSTADWPTVLDHFTTPTGTASYERPGYGDVMHGYRPAAERVPPSQDGPVAAPPPASSDS